MINTLIVLNLNLSFSLYYLNNFTTESFYRWNDNKWLQVYVYEYIAICTKIIQAAARIEVQHVILKGEIDEMRRIFSIHFTEFVIVVHYWVFTILLFLNSSDFHLYYFCCYY